MELDHMLKALGEPMRFKNISGSFGKKALCPIAFQEVRNL